MKAQKLVEIIGSDFYTGVPDSRLRALCDYLLRAYGVDPRHHIIAANEGGCVALAAGYHLATGKIPVVYMQNSGEGNAVNPIASLIHRRVYAIPVVFIVGWRGEPGVPDEPQHSLQGEVTLKLLEDMGVAARVIGADTSDAAAEAAMARFTPVLSAGGSAAFVIRKGALTDDAAPSRNNVGGMTREDVIRRVVSASGEDPVVCTTGKASRELFEAREANRQSHKFDFLTVGSMGHAASIALGVALHRPRQHVWCVDGDGAALMHMGSMAVLGACRPKNLVHIIINNGAHDSVGGMPTAATETDFAAVARACGYPHAERVDRPEALERALAAARYRNALSLIEVKCAVGARANLGRPTASTYENKRQFMEYLNTP